MKILTFLAIFFCWEIQSRLMAENKDPKTPGKEIGPVELRQRILDKAFAFIVPRQNASGSFSFSEKGSTVQESGVTSLVGLGLLSQGALDPKSSYYKNLIAAVDFVLSTRDQNGLFRDSPGGGEGSYCHFFSTFFLAKVSGKLDSKRNKLVEEALPSAVAIILDAQNLKKTPEASGGWRYLPTSLDSDISCTVCAVAALASARKAGVDVPKDSFERAALYALRLQDPDSGGFGYTTSQSTSFAQTAMGLAILSFCEDGFVKEADGAVEFLLKSIKEKEGRKKNYVNYGAFWGYHAFALGNRSDAEKNALRKWILDSCRSRQEADGSIPGTLTPVLSTVSAMLALSPPE